MTDLLENQISLLQKRGSELLERRQSQFQFKAQPIPTRSFTRSSFMLNINKVQTKEPSSPLKEKTVASQKTVKELMREILRNPKRSDADAEFLKKHFAELKFFREFKESNSELVAAAENHLIKNLGYEIAGIGQLIFQEGDSCNGKMYIVLSGEVAVIRKNVDFFMTQNLEGIQKDTPTPVPPIRKLSSFQPLPVVMESKQLDSPRKNTMIGAIQRRDSIMIDSPRRKGSIVGSPLRRRDSLFLMDFKDPETLDKYAAKFGKIVDRITSGGFFGEKALVSKNPRSATIITMTECEFLIVSDDLFTFIRSRFERTNTQKLNFLFDYFPFLEMINNKNVVEALIYVLDEKSFIYKDTIITEKTKGKEFYIIADGTCEVYKCIEEEQDLREKEKNDYKIAPKKKEMVLLCTLSVGEFIGEEILFNKSSQYEYTIKTTSSKINLFSIEKSKFKVRFPQGCWDGIKVIYRQKVEKNEELMKLIRSEKFRQRDTSLQAKKVSVGKTLTENMTKKEIKSRLKVISRGNIVSTLIAAKEDGSVRSPKPPRNPQETVQKYFERGGIDPEVSSVHQATMEDLSISKFDFGRKHNMPLAAFYSKKKKEISSSQDHKAYRTTYDPFGKSKLLLTTGDTFRESEDLSTHLLLKKVTAASDNTYDCFQHRIDSPSRMNQLYFGKELPGLTEPSFESPTQLSRQPSLQKILTRNFSLEDEILTPSLKKISHEERTPTTKATLSSRRKKTFDHILKLSSENSSTTNTTFKFGLSPTMKSSSPVKTCNSKFSRQFSTPKAIKMEVGFLSGLQDSSLGPAK